VPDAKETAHVSRHHRALAGGETVHGRTRGRGTRANEGANVAWICFPDDHVNLLDFIDFLGNNGGARTGQSDALMPRVLADVEASGMTIAQVKEAMKSIGHSQDAIHQRDRGASKPATGKFGK
jgi:hypothetical protein